MIRFFKNQLNTITRSWTEDSDWLLDLLNQTGFDHSAIQEEIDYLLWEYEFENPEASEDEITDQVCQKLIIWSSSKGVASAGITTAPVSLPIIGSIGTATLGTALDLTFLIRTQIELCYAIAAVYRVSMTEIQLKASILAILGYSNNDEIAMDITKTSINQLIHSTATRFLSRGIKESSLEVVERLATRMLGRMVRWLPLISIPINASMNVNAIKSTGLRAKNYFKSV
nr:magnetosome protein Mad31 [Desulfobacteraceae bacterium]